jgi:diaminopimelate decarboxylase
MNKFDYLNNELYCEDVPISTIARNVGTPFYLYSYYTLLNHYRAFEGCFSELPHLVCYAYKANSNLSLCRMLANEGCGADVVSWGEMRRAIESGVPPEKIVFNGNGKTEEELENAIRTGILLFIVDSEPELRLLDRVAGRLKRKARVALRINPDIDPKTHEHLATGLKESKFGFAFNRAREGYKLAASLENIDVKGIHMHIGSQILEIAPFVSALEKLISLLPSLKDLGVNVESIDVGGGIGITYQHEVPPTLKEYAAAISPLIKKAGCKAIFEPGRVIVGNAGILVSKVTYIKDTQEKNFIVLDAGMGDLIRPAFYDAYHEIKPVNKDREKDKIKADVVGPICESGDYFAKDRIVARVQEGDMLAIFSAGAYGFAMSSNYNMRARAAEVLVKGDKYYIIRKREVYKDMGSNEVLPGILR